MADKVTATPEALKLLAEIVADHGPVLFHQSGGCCDGSSPMCYPQGEFLLGDRDVKLGEIGGAPFYIGGAQYEVWKHTDLVIDAVPGRGGMFSLDNGRERRFLTRSNLCAVPAAPGEIPDSARSCAGRDLPSPNGPLAWRPSGGWASPTEMAIDEGSVEQGAGRP